jgi:hypothetical protein
MAIDMTNATTASGFLNLPNQTTGGNFWAGILLMIICVMVISMIGFGIEVSLLVSLFIGIIIGTFLVYLGLMSMTWLGVMIALELGLIIYVVVMNPRNN